MPSPLSIPFNSPLFLESGITHLRSAYARRHTSGDGHFSRQCQAFLERATGAGKVLLTSSCTDALEMCALLLEIGPGDEVIVPAFTFVSTANAFVLRGARPVWVDIDSATLNLDPEKLAAAITAKTKAIIVVHYAGVACEMDAILHFAANHGLPVIEDNAHGLFGAYRGRPLGSFGRLATLSFHETKNLSCGEGGALLINDPSLIERAEILREKGTDRSRFFRGEVDKYSWRDLGSSFLPSDLSAALLWAQIENYREIQARRADIFARYATRLDGWAAREGVKLPTVPSDRQSSHHLFFLVMPDHAAQCALLTRLAAAGIGAVFHYRPLHLTPMGLRLGGTPGQCPVTESIAERLIRLPFYFDLTTADQDTVIAAVKGFTAHSP